jgi:tetratricopeptide (TPR) repeat protein
VIGPSLVERLLAEPGEADAVLHAAGALDRSGLDSLLTEVAHLAVSDADAAARLLDAVEAAARAARIPAVLPAAGYLRARLTLEAGEPLRALELIEAARDDYSRLGMTLPALRTELGRMHVLDDLGRHGEAAEAARELFEQLRHLPPDDDVRQLQASALGNLGVALGFTGRHDEARLAYQRSEAIWRELGAEEEAAAAVANQAVELTTLGRAGAAVDLLGAAAQVFERVGDRFWFAKCLGHRGEAFTAVGRLAEALVDYQTARAILDALGAHTEAWRLGTATASTFLALGLADEAVSVLDRIEPELRNAGLKHDLAGVLCTQGMAHARAGRPERARPLLTEAAELYRTVDDVPDEARALLELSACMDDAPARALVQRAADLLEEGHWPGVRCLAALRHADLVTDDPGAVQAHLEEARELAAELALPHLQQAVSLRLGTLRLRLGDLDGGIEHLSEALAKVELIGSSIHDETLRAAYVASRNAAQEELMRALLQRGSPQDLTRAAVLADRAKGRTLIELFRGAVGWTATADAESDQLTGELEGAHSALFAADIGIQPAVRATVVDLERRLSARQAMLRGAPPHALGTRPVPAALHEFTSLAYHVVGEEVVAFVTVGGTTQVHRQVTDRSRLLGLLDDLESHLGRHAVAVVGAHGGARAAACRRVLEELYLAVLAPIAETLPRSTSASPLLVVPHGPLHRVPFHALHDGYRYVLQDWVITVSPSLEVAAYAASRSPRSAEALVVGVADEATPFVEDEARTVAGILGDATTLIGEASTFERFGECAEKAGLVHLACHGLFRPENPAFSSLRLADRWVRAADVAALDLDGAVVVLSACESGRVGHSAGDEAIGLARGFLAAGARGVVVSQWLADDRWTAELMVGMHRHLVTGSSPAAALRLAQLGLARDHPHPFHWAPFIAVGAP